MTDPVPQRVFEAVERGTWLNERAQAMVTPQPAPPPPPPPPMPNPALQAIEANEALKRRQALDVLERAGVWGKPAAAGSSARVRTLPLEVHSGSQGSISFGGSALDKSANAGWGAGFGNLGKLGQGASAMWGPGQARKYVEGWKFPFYAAKTWEAALTHAKLMQRQSGIPAERNFWGEVWVLTKSAQMKAQGGVAFD